MKTRNFAFLALVLLLTLAAIAAGGGSVSAQSACSVEVGSMTATTQNYGSNSYGSYNPYNIQLTLPLSTSCQNVGGQLWAVGNVYDTVSNSNLGSANSAINFNGGYYSGQLVFTLPSSVVEHLLQVSISIYSNYNNGQYGSVVGGTSQTLTIHANSSYSNPGYPYNGNYPPNYNNGYQMYYCYQNGYCYYYPSNYYNYPNYQQVGSCYNGQAIVYYNEAYYYVSCYQYYHHHH